MKFRQPLSEPPEATLECDEELRGHCPISGTKEIECREFNDGTLSPLPSDPTAYWSDAYAAAWHCMPREEEEAYFRSDEYAHFANKLESGKLVLRKGDLSSPKRWKALGFFLARNTDVHSIRFHGVDLRVKDFYPMRACFVRSSLAQQVQRMRKREADASAPGASYAATDLESLSSSSADSPSPGDSSASPSPLPSLHSEWTGGWGVDIDQMAQVRRRQELAKNTNLRCITFVDNCLGVEADEEVKHANTDAGGARQQGGRSSALENVLSMLLFCELLESCNIWRQSLSDQQAVHIAEELLLKHPSLRSLSMRWNGITADGAGQMERVLHKMACQVQNAGGKEVGGAKFEELDLSFNRIDPAACPQLLATPYQIAESFPSASPPSVQLAPPPSGASSSNRSSPSPSPAAAPAPSLPLLSSLPMPPKPSAVPSYRVNLRSQMPHSALMLSHFLRLTTAVHSVCTGGTAAAALYQATRSMQTPSPIEQLRHNLRPLQSSA